MEAVWRTGVAYTEEIAIFTTSKVAIYLTCDKNPTIENQDVLLTSHRIVNGTYWINLSDIVGCESKSGFLTSSPKVILKVKCPRAESGIQAMLRWKCLACEEDNEVAGDLAKCLVCGTINNAIKLNVESKIADLISPVRLSFRGSGHKSFFDHLTKALEKQAWLESDRRAKSAQESLQFVAGVSGLIKKAETDRQRQAVDQTEAFGDLDGLMRQAGEMAKLAETIAAKLAARQQGDTLGDVEDREFRALIADLGLAAGSTNTSKSAYHAELAKQVCAFTERLFSIRSYQMVTLADLYCYFNRARGNDLVSPSDLHKAASLMDSMALSVKLRTLASGLLVLQSNSFSDDKLAFRLKTPVTPVDLATQESISIQLATELLAALYCAGKLCRDQTSSGPNYYPNRILQS